jgi:hypothetical protein
MRYCDYIRNVTQQVIINMKHNNITARNTRNVHKQDIVSGACEFQFALQKRASGSKL